ncbi:MAG: hypothetical protein HPY53_12385 [Brevinematales bacterium]|nr:hypothetical protein [Brevinematales bacterium]
MDIIYGNQQFKVSDKEAFVWRKYWHKVNEKRDYNCLNTIESEIIRGIYARIVFINGFDKRKEIKLPDGAVLASPVERIVIGDHGPYYEFGTSFIRTKLIIPEDQNYRQSPEYHDRIA